MSSAKRRRTLHSPFHSHYRAERFFDRLVTQGVIRNSTLQEKPSEKLRYLIKHGLAHYPDNKLELTPRTHRIWLTQRGSNTPWTKLSPQRKKVLIDEFRQWFDAHRKALLDGFPKRVRTAPQYLRHQANSTRKYAEALAEWLNTTRTRSSLAETKRKEYERMVRLAGLYQGVAAALLERQNDAGHSASPPHSL